MSQKEKAKSKPKLKKGNEEKTVSHKPSKKKLRLKITKKVVIIALACCVIVSVVVNIVQLVTYLNLKADADDVAWRLNNYRDLQNTQIEAVRTACRDIGNDIKSGKSDRDRVLVGLNLYSKKIGSEYQKLIFRGCIAPALLISDVTGEGVDSGDATDMVFDPEDRFNIKDNAFDNVRW